MLGLLRPSIMVNTTHFLNQLLAGYLDFRLWPFWGWFRFRELMCDFRFGWCQLLYSHVHNSLIVWWLATVSLSPPLLPLPCALQEQVPTKPLILHQFALLWLFLFASVLALCFLIYVYKLHTTWLKTEDVVLLNQEKLDKKNFKWWAKRET